MQRAYIISRFVFVTCLLAGLGGCSDDATPGDSDADSGPQTLAEELTAAGLPPGSYLVNDNDTAVCIRTYSYPGGGQVSEPVDLSGYEDLELLVTGDDVAIRGFYDELSARWTESLCVEYDAGVDELTNHESCGEEDCTPFSLIRLCANGGEPTFFAAVPDCGHNTYPAEPQ